MKIPAYFTGFSSKTDGSAGLRFSTQEIPDAQFSEFKRLLNAFGWLVFEEGENIPTVPKEKVKDDRKSQSQRLRGVLYRKFEQKGGDTNNLKAIDEHYDQEMERIINQEKETLE